jgi:hypothetical protein
MNIQVRTFTLSDIIAWMRNGALVLSPKFQRRQVWPPTAKSGLVDTVVRGLPMPAIFIRERAANLDSLEKTRDVVDGQQRLRTLLGYVDPKLLPDYDPKKDDFAVRPSHNKEIAGKTFDQLPDELKQAILDYEFTVFVFPAGAKDEQILDIFSRINSTGVKLTPQELRNAQFYGEFKTVTYSLGNKHLSNWREWHVFTETQIARMEEVELTADIVNMMLKGPQPRTKTIVDELYKRYDLEFFEGNEVSRRFDLVMDCIERRFAGFLPSLRSRGRTLFYALFATIYDRMFGFGSSLLERPKPGCIPDAEASAIETALTRIKAGTAPKSLMEKARGATTDLPTRTAIIDYLKKATSSVDKQ